MCADMSVKFVSTDEQRADVMTKALSGLKFERAVQPCLGYGCCHQLHMLWQQRRPKRKKMSTEICVMYASAMARETMS